MFLIFYLSVIKFKVTFHQQKGVFTLINFDYHMHSSYSIDCQEKLENIIEKSTTVIENKLRNKIKARKKALEKRRKGRW